MGSPQNHAARSTAPLWCAAVLLVLSGCARLQTVLPRGNPTTSEDFGDLGQASLERGHNFDRLHPTVRELLRAHEAEHTWVEHGVVELPLASCEGAVQFVSPEAHECALIALADGKGAVLVISKAGACSSGDCLEHSWAFLDVYDVPFSLPARRASDYRSLRQDLSREDASALWLAGFRGRSSETRFALEEEPVDSAPRIASYRSCRVAPDGHELVCRSETGDVLGLDPITSQQRLIARLGVEQAEQAESPVWWTAEGKLAARAGRGEHPQCAESCELVALFDWPVAQAATLRPAAAR